jgi:hypothetical protein
MPGTPAQPAARVLPPVQPLPVSTPRVVLGGIACWVVALVVTLVVSSLHTGARDWWPWACVAGIGLGAMGYTYVARGRGNAAVPH